VVCLELGGKWLFPLRALLDRHELRKVRIRCVFEPVMI
jgi:hypothetical protein